MRAIPIIYLCAVADILAAFGFRAPFWTTVALALWLPLALFAGVFFLGLIFYHKEKQTWTSTKATASSPPASQAWPAGVRTTLPKRWPY